MPLPPAGPQPPSPGLICVDFAGPGSGYSAKVRRWVALLLAIAGLLSACGDGAAGDSTTTTLAVSSTTTLVPGMDNAHDAVAFWIDSLVLGRYDRAHMTVEPNQFLLAVAAEGETSEIFDQMASTGVPVDARVNFWTSFVDGFEDASGARLDTLAVQAEAPFQMFGGQFAVVELLGPDGGVDMVAVRDQDRGTWYVDLIGSFGPSLVPLFQPWVAGLEPESAAMDAMQQGAVSWQVSAARLPDWDTTGRESIDSVLRVLSG